MEQLLHCSHALFAVPKKIKVLQKIPTKYVTIVTIFAIVTFLSEFPCLMLGEAILYIGYHTHMYNDF